MTTLQERCRIAERQVDELRAAEQRMSKVVAATLDEVRREREDLLARVDAAERVRDELLSGLRDAEREKQELRAQLGVKADELRLAKAALRQYEERSGVPSATA